MSNIKAKRIKIISKELLSALKDLYEELVSIDKKNRMSELADFELNLESLGDKISIELYVKLKDMASEIITMPSRWSGDLEEAMRIDILTSKIEPLWANFDAEWKKHYH